MIVVDVINGVTICVAVLVGIYLGYAVMRIHAAHKRERSGGLEA